MLENTLSLTKLVTNLRLIEQTWMHLSWTYFTVTRIKKILLCLFVGDAKTNNNENNLTIGAWQLLIAKVRLFLATNIESKLWSRNHENLRKVFQSFIEFFRKTFKESNFAIFFFFFYFYSRAAQLNDVLLVLITYSETCFWQFLSHNT